MSDKEGETSEKHDDKLTSEKLSDSANATKHLGLGSSSSPIEIRQSACGKFGVLHARPPPSPTHLSNSNGKPVSIDELIKTANTMSSMMMAHKIALEDDFKLEPGMDVSGPLMSLSPIIGSSPSGSSGPSLRSRVKDIVHEAYWDLFKEELKSQSSENKDERRFEQSKQLFCDIRQKIVELLLPQHSRLKEDIEDKLDAKIIDQLARCDSLNLIEYGHYILSVLAKLCAPVRDEKLKELSEQQDIVQLYRGIMELLELMRLDLANFTINRFKPHIKAHSQEYEREKFNEILKQQRTIGIDGLEYTRIWLDRAVKKLDTIHGIADLINCSNEVANSVGIIEEPSSSRTDSESKRDKILRSSIVDKVLNLACCELLEWTPETQQLYPETLLFDEATFKSLSEQYKVLLMTSSILLTAFAFLSRFKLHENNEFKMLIKAHIITLLTASYDRPSSVADDPTNSQLDTSSQIKLETITTRLCEDIRLKIKEVNPSLLETFERESELLKRQILDLQTTTNRVRELAKRRISEFVETLLDLDAKHQQKCPSKMPPPVNIPLGLNCLTDEITLTMAQIVKIVRYNRKVFQQHYQEIIVDLVSKMI